MKNGRVGLYSETWAMQYLPTHRRVEIEATVYGLDDGLEVVVNLDTPSCAKKPLFGEIRVQGKNWIHTMALVLNELQTLDLAPDLNLDNHVCSEEDASSTKS